MILFSRTALIDPEIQLSAQRLSTRFSFFGLGFATAAWAPLIPFAQQRLHFNHADFGLLLLCSSLGAMLLCLQQVKLFSVLVVVCRSGSLYSCLPFYCQA